MTQARRLLAYRDRRGGFSSLSDIDEVPGFPEYVREDLKRRVSL
jgi:DNA uptake protein ComE-like DNA-binding protein